MGPVIRPFSYARDPWWDATGRVARRRRRRRLLSWIAIVALGMSLGLTAAQSRAATGAASVGAGAAGVSQGAAGAP
ncbi:MAG: hypothetical protein HY263_10180 [Chloroflexi bacterium]|nr:hypothetical protein [Chloroflexota bacterium]